MMAFQQVELPKDKAATESQKYGWELSDFLADNFWYLIAIVIVLAVFLFARYRWSVLNSRKHKN